METPANLADQTEQPQPTETSALLPLRLLGLGLLFAWDWFLHGSLTTSIEGDPTADTLHTPAMVAVEVCTLVILALLARRVGTPSQLRWLIPSGGAAGVLGGALVLLGANELVNPAVSNIVAGALVGYATAVLTLGWAEVYSRLGPARVFAYGSASLVCAGGLYWLALQGSPAVRLGCTVIIPAACCVQCLLSIAYVGPEPYAQRRQTRYSFPWKPVIIMGVCGFAAAFVDVALFAQGTLPHIVADTVVGGVLTLVVVICRRRVKPVALVGFSLACTAAGVVLVAFMGAEAAFWSSLLTMTSYVVATFFTYALLANVCYRYDVPSLWLFGFAVGARAAMDHVGGLARMAFPQLADAASKPFDLAVMAVVGLVVIGVVLAIWLSERSFSSNWAIQGINIQEGRHVPSPHEIAVTRCEHLAAERGLTEREAEVLLMLVEGRTYQQICQTLLLSPNTVKTHARHVYGKLGVHTRAEAVELAESVRP